MTVKSYYKFLKESVINSKDGLINLLKQFTFSYVIITLCYIGLIFVNYAYGDDIRRLDEGNRGWMLDARYLMHYIYQFFTVSITNAIAVASPYTYFLTTAFLAFTSLILARYFNRKNIYISLIITCLISISPFYWGNIIFIFDRLGMAISLCCTIAITLFSYRLNHKNAFVFQLITLFTIFFLYQIMLLAFILLVAFLYCYNAIENKLHLKIILQKAVVSIASICIASIIFWILNKSILNNFKEAYARNVVSIDNDVSLNYIIERLYLIFNHLFRNWQNSGFGYLVIITMILFITFICYCFAKTRPKPFNISLFIIALIITILSPTFILLISDRGFYSRFYPTLGLLISIALLYFYNNTKNKMLHKIALTLVILLLFSCFAMASYLTNRLQLQAEHETEISTWLHEDIYHLENNYPKLKFLFINQRENLIKKIDVPNKNEYLPEVNSVLTPASYFIALSTMKSKLMPLIVLTKVFPSLKDINNKEQKEIVDRRYYTILYYPKLNLAEVRYKKDIVN